MFPIKDNKSADLSEMTIKQLVHLCRDAIHDEHWEHFQGSQDILTREDDDKNILQQALLKLYKALDEADQKLGKDGRDSNVFEFYDRGLGVVLERLKSL